MAGNSLQRRSTPITNWDDLFKYRHKDEPVCDIMADMLKSIYTVISLAVFPILITIATGWMVQFLASFNVFQDLFKLLFWAYPAVGAFFGGVLTRLQIDREWRERTMWYFVLALVSQILFAYYVWLDITGDHPIFSLLLPFRLMQETLQVTYLMPLLGLLGIVFGRTFALKPGYPVD